MRTFIAVMFSICLMAPLAAAQGIIGSTTIDGKKINILEGNVWVYATPSNSDCDTLSATISFCNEGSAWKAEDIGAPDALQTYVYGDKFAAIMIEDNLGSNDGITVDAIEKFAIDNAATAGGVSVDQVKRLGKRNVKLGGSNAREISYAVNVDGLDLVYVNTLVVRDEWTYQFMTYSLGLVVTPQHKTLHDQFIDDIELR
ncbi:MAG: hypothetical protein AAGH90_06290 [Pseudomonadota bacterium]